MATEVVHGPHPKFAAEITPGEFWCKVVGHYTATPGLAAAGVTQGIFESNRPVKQVAELLALRTAFLEWFRETYQDLTGGSAGATAKGQVEHCIAGWK